MPLTRAPRKIWISSTLVAVALVGCGGGQSSTQSGTTNDKLRVMTSAYAGYLAKNKGKAPHDEAAFREYLNTSQRELEPAGLTADQVFVSPRNGAQLNWLYGGAVPKNYFGMKIVAYENEKGPDGKRMVISTNGMSDFVDDAQLRVLFPGAL